MGQEQNSRLTVDFHESNFLSTVAKENSLALQKGFWFQLNHSDQGTIKVPWGPTISQTLNRYAYSLNNPICHTDPTGHRTIHLRGAAIGIFTGSGGGFQETVSNQLGGINAYMAGLTGVAGATYAWLGAVFGGVVGGLVGGLIGAAQVGGAAAIVAKIQEEANAMSRMLNSASIYAGTGGELQIHQDKVSGAITVTAYNSCGAVTYTNVYNGSMLPNDTMWSWLMESMMATDDELRHGVPNAGKAYWTEK